MAKPRPQAGLNPAFRPGYYPGLPRSTPVWPGSWCKGESLAGPKLRSDIVDVLVKFRKEQVALASDVNQSYHQIPLKK